jgi:hypothetical protein
MPLITLDNLSLSFSEKPILNEVSATILKSDKIALRVLMSPVFPRQNKNNATTT